MPSTYLQDEEDSRDFINTQPESNDSGPTPGADIDLGYGSPVFGSPVSLTPGPTPAQQARRRAAAIATERPVRPGSMVPGPGQVGQTEPSGDTLAGQGQVKAPGGPGFWRNLASIGVGLAGGYANASMPRGPQVDVGQAMDNVKFGGYNRKVEDWAKRENDASLQAEQLTKAEQEQKGIEELGSRTNLQTAEANHANAAAESLRHPKPVREPAGVRNTIQQGIDAYAEMHKELLGPDGKLDWSRVPAADKEELQFPTRPKAPAAVKPPHENPSETHLKMRATGAKTGNAEVDAMTPAQAKSALSEKPVNNPLDAIAAREDRIDARAQQNALRTADTEEQTGYGKSADEASKKLAELDRQYNGQKAHPWSTPLKQTDPEYAKQRGAIIEQWRKDKQIARNKAERVYAQYDTPYEHIEYGDPTKEHSGAVPSTTPSGPGRVAPVGPGPGSATAVPKPVKHWNPATGSWN